MKASSRAGGLSRRPPIRRGQAGFTLVELLVVIVILGILSAVVVFAVRGSGDKGKEAAVATDARTIRTAQEAYCAQAGHYATEAQLTGAAKANDGVNTYKFLSEPSKYRAIGTDPATADQGNCPGPGPNKYKLECREPNCGLTLGGGPPIPDPALATCGQPGGWCPVSPPLGSVETTAPENLVRLDTGKVLAFEPIESLTTGVPTEIWDPAQEAAGRPAWTPGPSGAPPGSGTNTLVKLGGDLCAPSCGKVLVLFGGHPGHWELYDPTLNVFTPTSPGLFSRNHYARAAQIRGSITQCGANCGKVLIVGDSDSGPGGPIKTEGPTPPIAELFDPRTTTFSTAGFYADSANPLIGPVVAALSDGRVLLVGDQMVNGVEQAVAKLFDPLKGTFSDAAPPRKPHVGGLNPPVVFADDSVLIDGNELYRPDPPETAGSWTPVTPCGTSGSCLILASLPDGRVLANGNAGFFRAQGSRDMFLFDPKSAKWSQTGSLISAASPGGGIYLPESNKVLVVGQRSAEIYTPPPP